VEEVEFNIVEEVHKAYTQSLEQKERSSLAKDQEGLPINSHRRFLTQFDK